MKNLQTFDEYLMENEHLIDELMNEEYVSPQEKERKLREAEEKLKITIRELMDKIKKDPKRAEIHKAALDIALAKQTVFALTKKWKEVKERHAKMSKK